MADDARAYPPWMSVAQAPDIAEVFQSFWTWAHTPLLDHETSRGVSPIVADLLLSAAWDRLSLGRASSVSSLLLEARPFSLNHSTRHWMQAVFHVLEIANVRASGAGDRTLDDATVISHAIATSHRVARHRDAPFDPRLAPPPDWVAIQRRLLLSEHRSLRETALAIMASAPADVPLVSSPAAFGRAAGFESKRPPGLVRPDVPSGPIPGRLRPPEKAVRHGGIGNGEARSFL